MIISKYKNIFAEVFLIKKVKNTLPWTYVKEDFNGEEVVESFMKKN